MRVLAIESATDAVILDERAMGPADAAFLVERLVGWTPSVIELREAEGRRETTLIDCLEMLVRVGDGPEGTRFRYTSDVYGGMWIACRTLRATTRKLNAKWTAELAEPVSMISRDALETITCATP